MVFFNKGNSFNSNEFSYKPDLNPSSIEDSPPHYDNINEYAKVKEYNNLPPVYYITGNPLFSSHHNSFHQTSTLTSNNNLEIQDLQ